MPLRIVIAAWHLKNFNVGIGRYSRELIEALGRVDTENVYEILMPDDACRFTPRPNMRYRTVRFPVFKRRFWEQVAPCLVGRYDLLHFPYDSCIGWKRGRFVATIHDVKPLIFGELHVRQNIGTRIEQAVIGDRWAKIDHVLTDSECSKRDIVARLGVPAERLTVVYPGVDMTQFSPAPSGQATGERPYVLSVAGPDPTKNVQTLIEAFAALPVTLREAHDLVLAGDFRKRTDLHALVRERGIEGQTVWPGVVSDRRLVELYRGATLFVFPSKYEGFGLPVLEAMACGCPVICSTASSLPEVAGTAAVLVPPTDLPGLTAEMARVLGSETVREDLRQRGLAQAAQFSWDRTARETVAVYRRVAVGVRLPSEGV